MNQLDNKFYIRKFDKNNVLSSIENLPCQFEQVIQDFSKIQIPPNFFQVKDILINGMGGSGLGGHIVQSLFFDQLPVPLRVINSYTLPRSTNQNTLYLLVSYSGSTEEPLATYQEAKKRKAKIFAITSGGKVAALAKKDKTLTYIFTPRFNPSGKPRLGLGYTLAAQLLLLNKMKLLRFGSKQQSQAIKTLDQFNKVFSQVQKTSQNLAKKIAFKLYQKTPILVGSEFLIGSVHTFANQFNETAKTFATYFVLPELNHHLIEGLAFPKTNQRDLIFLLINSAFYLPKTQLRYQITEQVLVKNKIATLEYQPKSADKISQALEVLSLGSYVSFYLAILNKVDPSEIPCVDYFKKMLSQNNL
jgi:glucose/mannose-6-phosphate isomerase